MSSTDVQQPAEQTQGFLVVRTAASWHVELERHAHRMEFEQGWGEGWAAFRQELREAFPEIDPVRYRGSDREPIERWMESLDALLGKNEIDERNIEAQRLVRERLGPNPTPTGYGQFFDPDLLPSLEFAVDVLAAVDDPSEWEVISVARLRDDSRPTTLGFDVGYWAGGYSIIRDSLIAPEWHAPPPEDFRELREQTRQLNANLLFDTAEEARQFRAWYRTKAWAETEGYADEFQILRVDDVGPSA